MTVSRNSNLYVITYRAYPNYTAAVLLRERRQKTIGGRGTAAYVTIHCAYRKRIPARVVCVCFFWGGGVKHKFGTQVSMATCLLFIFSEFR